MKQDQSLVILILLGVIIFLLGVNSEYVINFSSDFVSRVLSTLIGAFAGALGAYWFQRKAKKDDELQEHIIDFYYFIFSISKDAQCLAAMKKTMFKETYLLPIALRALLYKRVTPVRLHKSLNELSRVAFLAKSKEGLEIFQRIAQLETVVAQIEFIQADLNQEYLVSIDQIKNELFPVPEVEERLTFDELEKAIVLVRKKLPAGKWDGFVGAVEVLIELMDNTLVEYCMVIEQLPVVSSDILKEELKNYPSPHDLLTATEAHLRKTKRTGH